MKRFLWTLLLTVFAFGVYADTGNCIKYKARFELRNGQFIDGYFYYATWDTLTFKFTDKSFSNFLDGLFSRNGDTLMLFLRIQTLKYPKLPPTGEGQFQYQAATEKDIRIITKMDIVASHFIDYFPPDEWNRTKENWIFGCSGQNIQYDLTQAEINLLQQKPNAQYTYVSYDETNNFDYQLLSYNPKVTEQDLILISERLKELNKITKECTEGNSYICYKREYEKIKNELHEKNVIVFF